MTLASRAQADAAGLVVAIHAHTVRRLVHASPGCQPFALQREDLDASVGAVSHPHAVAAVDGDAVRYIELALRLWATEAAPAPARPTTRNNLVSPCETSDRAARAITSQADSEQNQDPAGRTKR